LALWIKQDEFDRKWGEAYRSVFSRAVLPDRPFKNSSWAVVLLVGGLRLNDVEAGAVAELATSLGDVEYVAVDAERKFPRNQLAVIGEWTADPIRTHFGSWLGHTTVHLFGRSSTWGLVASNEDLSILGAPRGHTEVFVSRVGGEEYLRAKFLEEFAENPYVFGGPDSESRFDRLLQLAAWVRD